MRINKVYELVIFRKKSKQLNKNVSVKDQVLVLGASLKPERYSNIAIKRLRAKNYPVIAIGRQKGNVLDVTLLIGTPSIKDIQTITLYLGPKHQESVKDYIISLNPKRIIFNPGTEHEAMQQHLRNVGIEVIEACTLVMLSTGEF